MPNLQPQPRPAKPYHWMVVIAAAVLAWALFFGVIVMAFWLATHSTR